MENIYFLDIESLSSQGTLQNVFVAAVSSLHFWCTRLEHPSMSKLNYMQSVLAFSKQHNKLILIKFLIYQNKNIFLVSHNNISQAPFDLLHIDIWVLFVLFSLLLTIVLGIFDHCL